MALPPSTMHFSLDAVPEPDREETLREIFGGVWAISGGGPRPRRLFNGGGADGAVFGRGGSIFRLSFHITLLGWIACTHPML